MFFKFGDYVNWEKSQISMLIMIKSVLNISKVLQKVIKT